MLDGGSIPNDSSLRGTWFTYQALGILPDSKAPYGFYLESTKAAKCTIGGPFTGWSGGFTVYNYHRKDSQVGWYYRPFALVMELK